MLCNRIDFFLVKVGICVADNLGNVNLGNHFGHTLADDSLPDIFIRERRCTILLFTKYLPKWREDNPGKVKPEITDGDPLARRIAMAIEHLRQLKRNKLAQQQ